MPSLLARVADDLDRALDRPGELLAARMAVRVGQLGDDEGVDPLAVCRAVNLRKKRRLDGRCEQGLHVGKPCEVAVVREYQGHVLEGERMAVLQRDLDACVVGHASDMGEEAAGADFFGQVLQVPIEDRELLRVVGVRPFGVVAGGVPGAQAEAGEVQQVEHLRHVRLAHQRGVGLIEEVVEQHGLAEIEQRAAHARSV